LCSVSSNILVQRLTKSTPFEFKLNNIAFYSYYFNLIPLSFSLLILFKISLNTSRYSYEFILKNVHKFIKKYKYTVIINRLTNSLKNVDRYFPVVTFDLFTSAFSILSNFTLCLIAIFMVDIMWGFVMAAIILLIFSSMLFLNRRFMWARR
jgi:ABC-type multidrug transport system fused ATPase/permease subunit